MFMPPVNRHSRHKRASSLFFVVAAVFLLRTGLFISSEDLSVPKESGSAVSSVYSYLEGLFPEESYFSETRLHGGSIKVSDGAGNIYGYILSTKGHSDHIHGYAGPTPVAIALSPEGSIKAIKILPSSETPAFVEKVRSSGFKEEFRDLHWKKVPEHKVDAVTGATITSISIINSIKHRLSILDGEGFSPARSVVSIERIFLYLIVPGLMAFLAVLISLMKGGRKRLFRTLLLLVSFFWLGLIRAEMVSVGLLYGWLVRGIVTFSAYGLLLITFVSIIFSFFFEKKIYCHYLCPFGAAQEFCGKMFFFRKRIPSKYFRILSKARFVFLLCITLAVGIYPSLDLSAFEPFSVFTFHLAAGSSVIIAVMSIAASFFYFRPWCSFLCPTGAFFDILMFKKKGK